MSISRRRALRVVPAVAATSLTTGLRAQPLGDARLMQGPMLGAVYPDRVHVWGRASDAYELSVAVSLHEDMRDMRVAGRVAVGPGSDYTGVVVATGLRPDSRYHYRVFLDGKEDDEWRKRPPLTFRTVPETGKARRFRVAFGSCARYSEDPQQPIWEGVAALQPDLFFWLGDNIYGDSVNPATLAEEYRRQRDVRAYRPLMGTLPQLAIWDDHDYGINNYDRRNPIREEALTIFRRYWANPAYGADGIPGVFFTYQYGGVDFFFLDGRYHRSPNEDEDGPGKTQLGAEQLAWLKAGLRVSTAPFKVLVSGGGWSRAKGPGGDSWAAFLRERDDLLSFIQRQRISGVIGLSGDTHVAELNCIPRSDQGGYDFYDLTSSPLAQNPTDSWVFREPEVRVRPVFFEAANFGLLEFDLERLDGPALTYNVYDRNAIKAWPDFEVTAAELTNGMASYKGKVVERSK